jgi:hypothetical protein
MNVSCSIPPDDPVKYSMEQNHQLTDNAVKNKYVCQEKWWMLTINLQLRHYLTRVAMVTRKRVILWDKEEMYVDAGSENDDSNNVSNEG